MIAISDSIVMSSEELALVLGRLFIRSESVRVCSAYVTGAAVKWLTSQITHCNVTVLGRFSPRDFKAGASDLNALFTMVELGYRVKMLPSLHAKIYDIDRHHLFTGSANFTANGLSLCSTPNIEACVQLEVNAHNLAFIDKLFSCAIELDAVMLLKMCDIVNGMAEPIGIGDANSWPCEFYLPSDELFVIDLPSVGVGESCELYHLFPNSEFARISSALLSGHQRMAKEMLLRSRVIRWLQNCVAQCNEPIGIRFGDITSRLHRALQDDPSPYRKDVKIYQANLYHYIQVLLSDTFEIHVPGEASQFIRLRRAK